MVLAVLFRHWVETGLPQEIVIIDVCGPEDKVVQHELRRLGQYNEKLVLNKHLKAQPENTAFAPDNLSIPSYS
jgi:hypothetical protein